MSHVRTKTLSALLLLQASVIAGCSTPQGSQSISYRPVLQPLPTEARQGACPPIGLTATGSCDFLQAWNQQRECMLKQLNGQEAGDCLPKSSTK
jgi:hypothetical protein